MVARVFICGHDLYTCGYDLYMSGNVFYTSRCNVYYLQTRYVYMGGMTGNTSNNHVSMVHLSHSGNNHLSMVI